MATSPRRRTASHQVSAALLDAAETVLDRDGTAGVTVRAVAGEAAVSPTSVYNRFASKDGLTVALATRALDQLAEVIDVTEHVEPLERFRRACHNYRAFALEHPARYSLIFGAGSPLEDQTSAVARHGHDVFGILVGLIVALNPAVPSSDSTEAAQTVWSALHGAVTIEQAGIVQTASAAASFDYLLDLLTAALTGTSG